MWRGDANLDFEASMPVSHFFLMVIYAIQISVFFAVLWRRGRGLQVKLFLQIFISLMVGGLAVAWLLYPMPSAPPTGDPPPLIETGS